MSEVTIIKELWERILEQLKEELREEHVRGPRLRMKLPETPDESVATHRTVGVGPRDEFLLDPVQRLSSEVAELRREFRAMQEEDQPYRLDQRLGRLERRVQEIDNGGPVARIADLDALEARMLLRFARIERLIGSEDEP